MARDRADRPRRRGVLAAVAERAWRPLLALAGTLLGVSGPVHALGRPDLVYYLVLAGLTASAVAVPLGLVGLRRKGSSRP